MQGSDLDDHFLPGRPFFGCQPSSQAATQPPRLEGYPFGHLLITETGGPHIGHQLSQQGKIRLESFRYVRYIKSQIKIGNPVGEKIMGHGRNAMDEISLSGNRFHGSLDVPEIQFGQCCQGLRVIRFGLKHFQGFRVMADMLNLFRRQPGLDSGHLLMKSGIAFIVISGIRLHNGQQAVRIVQKPDFKHILKECRIFSPFTAKYFYQTGKVEARQGIAVIDPGVEDPAHEDNSIGIGIALDFLALEFHLMQGPFDQISFKSRRSQASECLQNQGLNLRGFLRIGTAKTHGKKDLLQIAFQAGHRRQIFPQT